MDRKQAIESSLEIAAERGGDLVPLVYDRLFSERPDLEPLFVLDRDGAVRGSMLNHALEVLLDAAGERLFARTFVQAETVNHQGTHGVDRDVFDAFYGVMLATVRDLAGPDWTGTMATGWQTTLDDLSGWIATAGADA